MRYHHELVAVDAAAFALPVWLAIREVDDGTGDHGRANRLLVAGLGGYLLAAPAVHLLRDNERNAGRSLFVRLAFPLVGFAVLSSLCDPLHPESNANNDDCGLHALGMGWLFAAPVAMLTDWTLFGSRVDAVPVVAPTGDGGATLGVGGRF